MHRDIPLVWGDGGYTGGLVDWCRDKLALTLQVVKRTDDMAGFVVLPRRWADRPRSRLQLGEATVEVPAERLHQALQRTPADLEAEL
ncbi:hypothetical protein BIV25_42200 [Streptomyces sp. MUSC 14]|nr:hypothetical protein BIV25_42200 [Streptomyces sp. MUSC 14]